VGVWVDPDRWVRDKTAEFVNTYDSHSLPPEIDVTVPSVARVYDYGLGGKDNFEVDRIVAEQLKAQFPGASVLAAHNRGFLRRGVRFLAEEAGIRQFIDVGSGLPTVENVHQIAHAVDPEARVVYVDIDPIVLAHGRALLADNDTTTVIQADAADPESILNAPETQQLIDFTQPWALVMAGILHHLSDEQDPVGVTRFWRDHMVPGSYLLASNFLSDGEPEAAELERGLLNAMGSGYFRSWEQNRAYFEGFELVEPGLVYVNDWHPDEETGPDGHWHTFMCGAVGRRP
jgi:hypothetical protein